jgi:hypothetical protein
MQASLIAAITISSVIAVSVLFGPRIAGQFMAWQENQRLLKTGADPNHTNPPAQSEAFDGALSPAWAFSIINGAGQIGRAPEFHSTSIEIDRGLVIAQHFDSDFERPTSQQYNNASLIGFQGYQPTPAEDVLFEARMQASPNFYGSAGFMVQPVGTIQSDGVFKGRFDNQAFTLFGVCFLGPESNLFGQSGATLQRVINWWPEAVYALPQDMHEMHTYQLRLRWVDGQHWQGIVSVDGQVLSSMNLPPLGPVEIHLWGDNYLLGTSFSGTPRVGFQNGESKWIRFESVSAWTESVQK